MAKLITITQVFLYEELEDAERDIGLMKKEKGNWVIGNPIKHDKGWLVEYTEIKNILEPAVI